MRNHCKNALEEFRKDWPLKTEGLERLLRDYQDEVHNESLRWTKSLAHFSDRIQDFSIRKALEAYRKERCSFVKRLGGQILRFSEFQYYIDLQVMEPIKPNGHIIRPSLVAIDGLFCERMISGGLTCKGKRIFIKGRPGIGKSILCKQILLRYDRKGTKEVNFTWILWIPLRKLREYHTIKEFFCRQYFGTIPGGGEKMSSTLHELILGRDKRKKLLILDGFDEIYGCSENQPTEWTQLMSFDYTIVTSRSSKTDLQSMLDCGMDVNFDLGLEALGYSNSEIDRYLDNDKIAAESVACGIRSAMKTDASILGLIQVPIHLDLLCSVWKDVKSETQPGRLPTTTRLYQVMEMKLWRRDFFRSQIPESNDNRRYLKDSTIMNAVQQEREVVQKIAIELIKERKAEFDLSHIDKMVQQLHPKSGNNDLARNVAYTSSICHGAIEVEEDRNTSYSFIHLTFQEYFAALWLAQDKNRLEDHISRHKYDTHFNRVWSFVAGIIRAREEGSDDWLTYFFTKVQEEPRDLLGPAHQRLVIRCLGEVDRLQDLWRFNPLRKKLEEHLEHWLLFEFTCNSVATSSRQMEFSGDVYRKVLEEATEDIKHAFLVHINRGPMPPPGVLESTSD